MNVTDIKGKIGARRVKRIYISSILVAFPIEALNDEFWEQLADHFTHK